jgi:hypothetical protein
MSRTIMDLLKMQGRVYLYFKDEKTIRRFMSQAKKESITYGDGKKLSERNLESIMALNNDKTVNFVGSIGHMAFGSGIDRIGDKKLLRIDYKKYADGEMNYLYSFH